MKIIAELKEHLEIISKKENQRPFETAIPIESEEAFDPVIIVGFRLFKS